MQLRELNVVIAPSGFKECLSPQETAAAIAAGVRRASPLANITELPLADGGEGFTQTMTELLGGTMHRLKVTGPLGTPVDSFFGMLPGSKKPIAIIEMAAAAGLNLVPKEKRDPMVTTTYGVGELILAALDAGAKLILIGCGDSGTNDGGAGLVQALGGKLLKADGTQIGYGGGSLIDLATINLDELDKRLKHVTITLACNIQNVLCGDFGVSRFYGPQKGATLETIPKLEKAMEHFAGLLKKQFGKDVRLMPGGGASGGMGAGLHALLGAKLQNRWKIIFKYFNLDAALRNADLVFTAEGGINFQTPRGKIPAEVARRAKKSGVPVFAMAGNIGIGAELNYKLGIDGIFSILSGPVTLEESMANARILLEHSTENVMRAFLAGRQSQHHPNQPGKQK